MRPMSGHYCFINLYKQHKAIQIMKTTYINFTELILSILERNIEHINHYTANSRVWISYKITTIVILNSILVWLLWEFCVTFTLWNLQCIPAKVFYSIVFIYGHGRAEYSMTWTIRILLSQQWDENSRCLNVHVQQLVSNNTANSKV